MKTKLYRYLIYVILLVSLSNCNKNDIISKGDIQITDQAILTDYFDHLRVLTKRTPGFSPPVASRAFGYLGLTAYEAGVNGLKDYTSLAGQLNGLTSLPKPEMNKQYHWGIVVNTALNTQILNFYPTATQDVKSQTTTLTTKYQDLFKIGTPTDVIERSEKYGAQIANAIFDYSKTDGGHEGYKSNFPQQYTVPIGEGFWVPTSAQLTPLQPYWGNNRTFFPQIADISAPSHHPQYSVDTKSYFYSQALEVYSISKNLTADQKAIATFWSDDPGEPGSPPGHAVSIATIVLKKEKPGFAKAAETYAKVGIALSDAFVCCWKCKFEFNLIRPESYVKQNIDPNWKPLLITPPFPEYTSGHSVQSAAGAKVMSELFGYNYSFIDNTHADRKDAVIPPRSFSSFDAAANEAALSRLYGGIHYREGIEAGIIQGNKIGSSINSLRFRK